MAKQIEELTDDDLMELWPAIGGTPHLFEHGKDELRQVLTTGECSIEYEFGGETKEAAIGLQLDYYTMAAIVDLLRSRGFETANPGNVPVSGPIEREGWVSELAEIARELAEWSRRYPRGGIYSMSQKSMDNELIELEERAKLLHPSPKPPIKQ